MKVRIRYSPTIAARTRMMSAIEMENTREEPSYQHCCGIFRDMQHMADEGTHAGHFQVLEHLWAAYGVEAYTKK